MYVHNNSPSLRLTAVSSLRCISGEDLGVVRGEGVEKDRSLAVEGAATPAARGDMFEGLPARRTR